MLILLVIAKRSPVVNDLFIIDRKLTITLAFITQSYFAVPKNIRLNFKHYFIAKVLNKQELQQIAFNHSSAIDYEDFTILYKKTTAKPYFLSKSYYCCIKFFTTSFKFQKEFLRKNIKTFQY